MERMRIGIAQINPTVGALKENGKKIIDYMQRGKKKGVDLIVFPELAITGYPPEDLLLKKSFVSDNLRVLYTVARQSKGISAIVGFVDLKGGERYNAAALVRDCGVEGIYRKMLLPNYGVFDEKRYFKPGTESFTFFSNHKTMKCALTICEDIWEPEGAALALCASHEPHVIINISASPYHFKKEKMRESMLEDVAGAHGTIVVYCTIVGGQDELVFDGGSMVVDARGEIRYRAPRFEEHLGIVDIVARSAGVSIERCERSARRLEQAEEIYKSLVLGTRDYICKNGFRKAVVGLSGGIDSCLTAKIACDAIGNGNVIGVSMPSRYSSRATQDDARRVAKNLGMRFIVIPMDSIFQSFLAVLSHEFKGLKEGIAEENLQARIRGNILMAFSNKFGWLVLTTGNKSEISMGYCTLYGDMAGGFSVIKDVPKTLVYKLARFVNAKGARDVIPQSVFTRPPTAELRPDQKDEDTLPPYKILDPILKLYIEDEQSPEEISSQGFDLELARLIAHVVDKNEYKRRQGPPGVKITPRAFGKDRRFPIVNRYRE